MGYRQSMVVLSKGDWVLVDDEYVCYVVGVGIAKFDWLVSVRYEDGHEEVIPIENMEKLPEELYPILSDSI